MFRECLSSVFSGPVHPREVILVDDAMDQQARQIAGEFPVTILPNRGKGVSAARNLGARNAAGSVILFMDTDVILRPDSLEILARAFREPDVSGIVGVQTKDLRFSNFASRYKNHWMRFTYLRLPDRIHLFYTSCAAIRRDVFMQTDGFDERYRLPSIEDTVFGAELGRKNVWIRPLRQFEVEHVKWYSWLTVLRTDIYRSAALIRYVLRNRSRSPGESIQRTSVPKRFIASAGMMMLTWAAILLAAAGVSGAVIGLLIGLAMTWLLNLSWLRYLKQEEGFRFGVLAGLFLPIDISAVVAGMIWGVIGYYRGLKY